MKFLKVKKFVSAVCLFLVIASVVGSAQDVLISRSEIDSQFIPGFYEERENSLDAVYIGSSNCYTTWNSAFAFKEHGICVYPYSSNGQPFYASRYLIEEARKTQKDAVFVVNINTVFDDTVPFDHFHNLINVMPDSLTKLRMINHLCYMGGYSIEDSWEFYFPFVRFHSRWDNIRARDFQMVPSTLKGASTTHRYLDWSSNVTNKYVTSDKVGELPEKIEKSINDMLDYCEKEKLKVLFVTIPQAVEEKSRIERYNAVNELISSRGFDTLRLENKLEEIGLNLKVDYYNGEHTNIHGSLKFTDYLSKYLIEKYGFKDKREDESYNDWHLALEEYSDIANVKVLPYEYKLSQRDYDMGMTKLRSEVGDGEIELTWDEVEEADGYLLYRKKKESYIWRKLTVGEDTSYLDTDVTTGKGYSYYYALVPIREEKGTRYYGDAYYNGKKVKT